MESGLKYVPATRNGFVLKQVEAICIRIISKPLSDPKKGARKANRKQTKEKSFLCFLYFSVSLVCLPPLVAAIQMHCLI